MMDVKLINALVTWIEENKLWNDGYEEMRSRVNESEMGWWVCGVCDYKELLYVIWFWYRYLGWPKYKRDSAEILVES
jgi:hypothetical protein